MNYKLFLPGTVCTLAVTLFLSLTSPLQAHDELRGKAFSDPLQTTEMPAGWEKKPIQYKSEVGRVDIAIDINQQLYPFILPLVQKFGKANNLKIAYSKGTCGKSFGMLNRKEIDIGGACCPPGDLDRLPGLRFHTLGIIPLAIFIHPDNPVDNVTFAQLKGIFQGSITNWSAVDGPDQPIKPSSSFHCRMRPGHWRLILDNEELFGTSVKEVGEMSDMIHHVAANPWTIGYEVLYVAERFKDRGQVKPLKIDGHSPKDLDHMLAGGYPAYRTFDITTWEGDTVNNPKAKALVAFLLKQIELIQPEQYGLITASRLKKAGWRFKGNELIGEPNKIN